jgi:hypothetical protein
VDRAGISTLTGLSWFTGDFGSWHRDRGTEKRNVKRKRQKMFLLNIKDDLPLQIYGLFLRIL